MSSLISERVLETMLLKIPLRVSLLQAVMGAAFPMICKSNENLQSAIAKTEKKEKKS
jgi:hypothetical protein